MMKGFRGFLAMVVVVGLSAGLAAMFSGCETWSDHREMSLREDDAPLGQ